MTGPVVAITGAARRLGRRLAETLHAAGYRIVLHCNRSTAEADAVSAALNRQRHDSASVVQAELTVPDIDDLAQQLLTPFGRIDHLINNASAFYPTPVSGINPAQFDELISKAKRDGSALAIAHPHEETINYLHKNMHRLEQHGIDLVPVSRLIAQRQQTQSVEGG